MSDRSADLLMLAQRSVVRALVVLVPVTIAVGLSSLAIAALGIELTPLTTVAGPLAIAVGTELSVLVAAAISRSGVGGSIPATP